MSAQADTWMRHTLNYLGAVDENLAAVFTHAMERAGYPETPAAEAIEFICAEFLAGPSLTLRRAEPKATGP